MIPKVVLDTNILISAIIFGGKPRDILQLVLHKRIIAVTSPSLITELGEVLIKKFDFLPERVQLIVKKLKRNFKVVNPSVGIHILKDEPDNRVLEAAIESNCDYIITGDKELLKLRLYKNIRIVNADKFVNTFGAF